jgi:phosphohistidine phosphatase
MKTLYVLRHAKSDWSNSSLKDFDRPLNDRGRKAGEAMGAEMRRRGVKPDLVLVSTALRARQTLALVQDGYGQAFNVRDEGRIYAADVSTLIDVVRSVPDNMESLMIVGHNPGLQDLVLLLADGPDDLRSEVAQRFPTAALAEIRFECDSWRKVAGASGQLQSLTKPRNL